MTLTEFLNARYDEEERRAGVYHTLAEEFGSVVGLPTPHQTELPIALAAQVAIARTSARILADIAAKRAIVAEFEQVHADYQVHHTPTLEGQRFGLMKAVSMLVQPFAEHADFDPAWRV